MTGRILQNGNVIEVRQGDSFTIKLQFKTGDVFFDLDGSELKMHVRDDNDDVIMDISGVVINSKLGQAALILTPEMTSVPVGSYKTDIQITFSDGSVNTFFPADVNKVGILKITEQVTR